MRVVFMGTPDFAVPALTALIGQGHKIVAVYTREPKPAGRGMALKLSAVHACADKFGLPVHTPKTLRGEAALELFQSHKADVAVVAAYGLILPPAILAVPELGCLNLHGSLLPRWRGAAPVQRAIMAGDDSSGVMVMQMEEGLDTGPVSLFETVKISDTMTAQDLHDQLAMLSADLIVRALAALERGSLHFRPQRSEGIVYATKIDKAEARIDWSKPATEVLRHIHGLSPFPGAYFEVDLGRGLERIKALRVKPIEGEGGAGLGDAGLGGAGLGGAELGAAGLALDDALTIACRTGAIRLERIQRAGKAPMSAEEFLRGSKVPKGTLLL